MVGILLFIVGAIVTIWYPIGSILQLAGLIVFGISANDLVSHESIACEMDNSLGYVGAWVGTLVIIGSTLPYLREFTIDQRRGGVRG